MDTRPDTRIGDASREVPSGWEPGKHLIGAIRDYDRHSKRVDNVGIFLRKFAVLRHRFWSAVTGADIPVNMSQNLGLGLEIPHPSGVVIHPDAVIGPNCILQSSVVIGAVRDSDDMPIIDGGVEVGSGAKIIGPVRVGSGSQIGANTVVTKSVPPDSTVVGVNHVLRPRSGNYPVVRVK